MVKHMAMAKMQSGGLTMMKEKVAVEMMWTKTEDGTYHGLA